MQDCQLRKKSKYIMGKKNKKKKLSEKNDIQNDVDMNVTHHSCTDSFPMYVLNDGTIIHARSSYARWDIGCILGGPSK